MKSFSRVRLLATPWTAAYQAPPSMGFSKQEYWSGVPLPSPPPSWILLKLVLWEALNWIASSLSIINQNKASMRARVCFQWCIPNVCHIVDAHRIFNEWKNNVIYFQWVSLLTYMYFVKHIVKIITFLNFLYLIENQILVNRLNISFS